ncbi:hypothetical protein OESDEN_22507 [Oesophagostomum dentatum]|uniref:Uncharacterized protein n=1 Tax=Oesophagostomum dentatum TaxID=61180 RepID=A0A0B1RXS7_OESDE|nr:hypothetical protein OESDEN_22507 [Oesophagostomum dentatum]
MNNDKVDEIERDFLHELVKETRKLSEEDREKMSDVGKAVKDAAELHDEIAKEDTSVVTEKLSDVKDFIVEKADEAKQFLEELPNIKAG